MSTFMYEEFTLKDFPLLQQLDNAISPSGTCNVTSLAMCFQYLQVPRSIAYAKKFKQFEDELAQRMLDRGMNRESPEDLKQLCELYGVKDDLIIATDWMQTGKALYRLIDHLKKLQPAVIHTYLTDYGHITTVNGVRLDDGKPAQWRLGDPLGEWSEQGYERNDGSDRKLGLYWLSHAAFTRHVLTRGEFWVHLLDR